MVRMFGCMLREKLCYSCVFWYLCLSVTSSPVEMNEDGLRNRTGPLERRGKRKKWTEYETLLVNIMLDPYCVLRFHRPSWFNAMIKCVRDDVVDTAYNCDPRIKKFKEEEKARKESEKKAKVEAKKREQEEKDRVWINNTSWKCVRACVCPGLTVCVCVFMQARQAEEDAARLAKEKEEEAAKYAAQQAKKEKEAQKKAIKKERQKLRTTCKAGKPQLISVTDLSVRCWRQILNFISLSSSDS